MTSPVVSAANTIPSPISSNTLSSTGLPTDPPAISAMQTAMTRIDIEWPMDEENPMRAWKDARLSLEKLLKGNILHAAIQLRVDDIAGSITVGKRANYNLYSVDLFEVPEDQFQYVVPETVVFEGRVLNQ